jgi:hypothetical protein
VEGSAPLSTESAKDMSLSSESTPSISRNCLTSPGLTRQSLTSLGSTSPVRWRTRGRAGAGGGRGACLLEVPVRRAVEDLRRK